MSLLKRRVLLSGGRREADALPAKKERRQLPVKRRPVAWVTWGIIITTVLVFLLQLLEERHTRVDVIGHDLAFSHTAWHQHRYWTVVTYAWAHATSLFEQPDLFWLHLASNLVPLWYLGPGLEEMLGWKRFLGLYLGGVVAAALVWLVCSRPGGESIIGASGAIFALLAAVGTAAPRSRTIVFLVCTFMVLPRFFSFGVVALLICAIELAQLLLGWMPQVAHAAHLGGAAFGFLYIALLRWRARRRSIPT